ncbi:Tectonic-1, partial [Blyttiomyces sp. JEL0837]
AALSTTTMNISYSPIPIPSGAMNINWSEVTLQPGSTNTFHLDIGPCTCDLTQYSCDPNCCCDPDCTDISHLYQRGGCFQPPGTLPPLVLCSQFLFRTNNIGSGTSSYKNSDGILCIVKNNSPIQGFYYNDPGNMYEKDNYFSERILLKEFGYGVSRYSVDAGYDSYGVGHPVRYETPYQIGDYLLASYGNMNNIGYFTVPGSGYSGICNDLNPTVWNVTTQTCNNVVRKLKFTFLYNVTSTVPVLDGVYVNVTFQSFKGLVGGSGTVGIGQEFEVAWSREGQPPPVPKSGNPGYLIGKPVLFGTLVTQPAPAIGYYADPLNGLTLLQDTFTPSTNLVQCSTNYTDRVPIGFGEDMLSGCTLYLGWSNFSSTGCVVLRNFLASVQTGGRVGVVDRVGRYGNSNVTLVDDWVPILVQELGDKSGIDQGPGICTSLLTEVDMQFLTADLGTSVNPQTAIIGARVVLTYGTFTYRCMNPDDCRGNNIGSNGNEKLQKFRLRNSVTFVKVSTGGAQPYVPPAPRLLPLLPDDLFYPFNLPTSGARR